MRHKVAQVVIFGVFLGGAIGGCSTSAPHQGSPKTIPVTSGDVTLTTCKQDNTELVVSGSVLNHASVMSNYSFVVEGLNDGLPAGQSAVMQDSVSPGVVAPWSSTITIAGGLGGSFTCRLRSVYRTASP